jgi:dihydroorotase
MRINFSMLFLLLCLTSLSWAQNYSLLLKGGHMIDPKNNIDAIMDIALSGDSIVRVATNIPESEAETVVDASGYYITPGLIDIHSHNFHGTEPDSYLSNSFTALPPDGFTFRVHNHYC